MTRDLLVPLDDSPQARRALEHALTVHTADDIVVFHVVDYSESLASHERPGRGSRKEGWYQKALDDAEELFADAQEIADGYDVVLSTDTDAGKPAEAIVSYADEHGIDQIIMGSHGRTGASRILLGSVAEKVIRRSPLPTTVVH